MARTTPKLKFPKFPGSGISFRTKLIFLLTVAGLAYLIVKYPSGSAQFVSTVINGFHDFVSALSA